MRLARELVGVGLVDRKSVRAIFTRLRPLGTSGARNVHRGECMYVPEEAVPRDLATHE